MSKIFTVNLPDIGEGVVEGEVIEWLKQPNDPLEQDEPVVVVMTDKATVELPAPYPGKLLKQYFKVGEIALRDKPLYDIEVAAGSKLTPHKEPTKEPSCTAEKPLKSKPVAPICAQAKAQPQTNISSHRPLASPATRKLAQEMGLDLNQITPTGREGEVTKEDLKSYAKQGSGAQSTSTPQPLPAFPGDQEKPLVGIRLLMAKKMAEAKREIPHFSYFEQVDVTRLVQLRERFKPEAAKEGISVTFMPFLIKALSRAICQYPEANSAIDMVHHKLLIHQEQHVGIAMSTPYGLIVPVLKNVEKQSLNDLIRSYHQLKTQAVEGKLHSSDMKGSTITISNFGVLDGKGLWATPIINYPEVAILAVARIQKEPVVKNGDIVIRDMLNLSWSFDHRVIDGEFAARFSHCFASHLHNPATLL